jgi:RNA polymerase sigma factor (sigma-70 family)
MNDDHALLQRYAQERDEAAFAELARRYAGAVHAAAMRQTGDAHAAEDVTQAAFILLARKAPGIGPQVHILGWLMRAANFAARDLMKAERRRRARETAAFAMNTDDEHPKSAPEPALWERVAPVLDASLARLAEGDRRAILLRFFQNKSLAEVGADLGVAEDAARKRVSRALDRLHAQLVRVGAETPAAALPTLLMSQATTQAGGEVVRGAVQAAVQSASGHSAALALSESVGRQLLWAQWKPWLLGFGAACVLGGATATWVFTRPEPAMTATTATRDDYRRAGFDDPRVVQQFVADVQAALNAGDRNAVIEAIQYPLRIHAATGSRVVGSADELRRDFDTIFTPEIAGLVLKSGQTGLFCTDQGVMVGPGTLWVAPEDRAASHKVARIVALNFERR